MSEKRASYYGAMVMTGTDQSRLEQCATLTAETLDDYGHPVERKCVLDPIQARISYCLAVLGERYEDPLASMRRMFKDNFAPGQTPTLDEEGLLRMDDRELEPEVMSQMQGRYDALPVGTTFPRALFDDFMRAYAQSRGFEIEGLGTAPGPKLEAIVVERVDGFMIRDDIWVLVDGDQPVCLCGFNATLPEIVQIGPVWTPPAHRNRGHARHLLAATLAAARDRGVARAILFTPSPAAAKAYEAVGFAKIGTYRIALLRDPVPVR